MTGTDLYVNKPHCAVAVRQKVPRSVEQRIVIKFLVGGNVPSAEIHHRLQQQYGEECLRSINSIISFISP